MGEDCPKLILPSDHHAGQSNMCNYNIYDTNKRIYILPDDDVLFSWLANVKVVL